MRGMGDIVELTQALTRSAFFVWFGLARNGGMG